MTERPIRLGVTGHRRLANPAAVRQQLDAWLMAEQLRAGPLARFTLLTCLAEGADSLAAEAIKCLAGATFIAVLPLARDDYRSDFSDAAARCRFDALLAEAAEVVEFPTPRPRPLAYQDASRYLVDRSDILLALWDGTFNDQLGGTADTLTYARQLNGTPRVEVLPVLSL